ncbi:hypothetical protein [Microlunatus speluncae]|uniref:hypothetical protein n=1 Tax=Microlunatus speluncae TaxID=2594267 RepID=UPI001266665C|nr:hypothetical protein [Microlunatus speluncae]
MSAPSPLSLPNSRLDAAALTEPVARPALDAFIADSKATDKPWRRMTTGLPRVEWNQLVGQLIPIVIPLAGLTFVLFTGGPGLVEAVWEFTRDAPFPLNLVIIGVVALILLGVLVALWGLVRMIRSMITPRWWWESTYRIIRFAEANGLRYGHDEAVTHPGIIFTAGGDRIAEQRLTTTTGRGLEIGNYRYTIRHEQSTSVFGWGYVAITLDRRLPHLLLDALDNNNRSTFGIRTSNLPLDLARDQKLSLGGEFDGKFTLYAPSGYGRDAFYIFAPDLMALFIDRLGAFDVEIIDDTMFVYGSRFDLLDPRTYDWLQELVTTVVARTVRRTERYSDDRALLEHDPAAIDVADRGPVFDRSGDGPPRTATNTVGTTGRRLRKGGWGVWAVIGLLLVGYYVYSQFVAPVFGLPTLGP